MVGNYLDFLNIDRIAASPKCTRVHLIVKTNDKDPGNLVDPV
jgi:hypothetical protein